LFDFYLYNYSDVWGIFALLYITYMHDVYVHPISRGVYTLFARLVIFTSSAYIDRYVYSKSQIRRMHCSCRRIDHCNISYIYYNIDRLFETCSPQHDRQMLCAAVSPEDRPLELCHRQYHNLQPSLPPIYLHVLSLRNPTVVSH